MPLAAIIGLVDAKHCVQKPERVETLVLCQIMPDWALQMESVPPTVTHPPTHSSPLHQAVKQIHDTKVVHKMCQLQHNKAKTTCCVCWTAPATPFGNVLLGEHDLRAAGSQKTAVYDWFTAVGANPDDKIGWQHMLMLNRLN